MAVVQKPSKAEISIYGIVIPLLNTNITHISAAMVNIPHTQSSVKVIRRFFTWRSATVTPIKQNLLMLPSAKQKAHKISSPII